MRFFLLLATALITFLDAKQTYQHWSLPGGLPDGSVLTIYFKHVDSEWDVWPFKRSFGPVHIHFFDEADVPDEDKQPINIPAGLRIERGRAETVYSSSKINGKWLPETVKDQQIDTLPLARGYWRVDVIKHNKFLMNVFFQGFWAGVRTFDKSLENLKSFGIISKFVDFATVEVKLKYPNSNFVAPTFDQFKDFLYGDTTTDRKLITLPGFPSTATIDLVAVLRAKTELGNRKPALVFKPADGSNDFLRISQQWDRFWYHGEDTDAQTSKLLLNHQATCTFEWSKNNGDLLHLQLSRVRSNTIMMKQFFKKGKLPNGKMRENTTCWITLSIETTKLLDKPFHIMSHDGAVIFHVSHTIPAEFPPSHVPADKYEAVFVARLDFCKATDNGEMCCDRYYIPKEEKDRSRGTWYDENCRPCSCGNWWNPRNTPGSPLD